MTDSTVQEIWYAFLGVIGVVGLLGAIGMGFWWFTWILSQIAKEIRRR